MFSTEGKTPWPQAGSTGPVVGERFGAVSRVLGRWAPDAIGRAHVAIVGLGGVGSWTAEALARTGVGRLTLIDPDEVCITNTNRQLPALTSTVGKSKASVLAARIRDINPACHIRTVPEFCTAGTIGQILTPEMDCVADAIDSLSNKAALLVQCLQLKYRVVTAGGAGGKTDPTLIRKADLGQATNDDLLRMVRKTMRRQYGFPRGESHIFGIPAVFSTQPPLYPWNDGVCRSAPEQGKPLAMDCRTGLGSLAYVSGALGLALAHLVVEVLLGPPSP